MMPIKIIFALSALNFSSLALATEPSLDEKQYPDFAKFEADGGCNELLDAAKDAKAIEGWDQERLDRTFACAKAGPIPSGKMAGTVVLGKGGNFEYAAQSLARLTAPATVNLDPEGVKKFAMSIWKGKTFYNDRKMLLNQIGPEAKQVAIDFLKAIAESSRPVEKTLFQKAKELAENKAIDVTIAKIFSSTQAVQQRFPAKVFCGNSLLDSRRESVIIDYYRSSDIKEYNPIIDSIASRDGLRIRDEIRMIHDGFYLGRAYLDRVFVLNFTLTRPADGQAPQAEDTCWPGEQR